MAIWITILNIFLSVLIFHHFFDKSDYLIETLDNKCSKDKQNMVYKQEDKLTKMNQRLRDIDLGVKLLDKSINENKKGINKNKVDLKVAAQQVKREADRKMKALDKGD